MQRKNAFQRSRLSVVSTLFKRLVALIYKGILFPSLVDLINWRGEFERGTSALLSAKKTFSQSAKKRFERPIAIHVFFFRLIRAFNDDLAT